MKYVYNNEKNVLMLQKILKPPSQTELRLVYMKMKATMNI